MTDVIKQHLGPSVFERSFRSPLPPVQSWREFAVAPGIYFPRGGILNFGLGGKGGWPGAPNERIHLSRCCLIMSVNRLRDAQTLFSIRPPVKAIVPKIGGRRRRRKRRGRGGRRGRRERMGRRRVRIAVSAVSVRRHSSEWPQCSKTGRRAPMQARAQHTPHPVSKIDKRLY